MLKIIRCKYSASRWKLMFTLTHQEKAERYRRELTQKQKELQGVLSDDSLSSKLRAAVRMHTLIYHGLHRIARTCDYKHICTHKGERKCRAAYALETCWGRRWKDEVRTRPRLWVSLSIFMWSAGSNIFVTHFICFMTMPQIRARCSDSWVGQPGHS